MIEANHGGPWPRPDLDGQVDVAERVACGLEAKFIGERTPTDRPRPRLGRAEFVKPVRETYAFQVGTSRVVADSEAEVAAQRLDTDASVETRTFESYIEEGQLVAVWKFRDADARPALAVRRTDAKVLVG